MIKEQLIYVMQLIRELDHYLSTDDENFSELENKAWQARQRLKVVRAKVSEIIEVFGNE